MSLLTAHKVLIATAIAFFLLYGALELRGYFNGGAIGGLLRGGASLAVAVGWALYLRTVKSRPLQSQPK